MTNEMGVPLLLYLEMPGFTLNFYCYNIIYGARFQLLSSLKTKEKEECNYWMNIFATFKLKNEVEFAKIYENS